jgi:putative addiction module component (TIGR02574 family)
MIVDKVPGIKTLSTTEKLLLANELWEQVEAEQGPEPALAVTIELLNRRFSEYRQDPSTAVRWEDFKPHLNGQA